jgi:hypothetical protein
MKVVKASNYLLYAPADLDLDVKLKEIDRAIVENFSPQKRENVYASAIMTLAQYFCGTDHTVHEITVVASKNGQPLEIKIVPKIKSP